jgi:radical SAM protein with 4Fe4S-binding SPASM domain
MARTYARCHAFDLYCLIDALGNVTPCNIFYGDKNYIFGNINNQSLKEIWESGRKMDIINKITSLDHALCKEYRCRQDVMNRYLERIKKPELNDEFI